VIILVLAASASGYGLLHSRAPSRGEAGGPEPSASPSASTPVAVRGWDLTRANTGLAAHGQRCDSLEPYTGPSRPAAGTVISQKRIEKPLVLAAGNITISRSCVRPTAVGRGLPILSTVDPDLCDSGNCAPPARVAIRDSDIDGSALSPQDAAFTTAFYGVADLTGNYVHDVGSGLAIIQTGDRLNVLVEHNFVTRLRAWGNPAAEGNHSDAATVRGFSTRSRPRRVAVIRNNRFDCDSANATGALVILTIADDIDNLLVEGNLLEGGGYHLSLGQDQGGHRYGANLRAVRNRFGAGGWTTYVADGRGWAQWSGNHVGSAANGSEPGAIVPRPEPIAGRT